MILAVPRPLTNCGNSYALISFIANIYPDNPPQSANGSLQHVQTGTGDGDNTTCTDWIDEGCQVDEEVVVAEGPKVPETHYPEEGWPGGGGVAGDVGSPSGGGSVEVSIADAWEMQKNEDSNLNSCMQDEMRDQKT